ncbi:MAG: DUF6528 family protein [Stackebrandtia sp.]
MAIPAGALAGTAVLAFGEDNTAAAVYVAVTEQESNRVIVFDKDKPFTDENIYKTFGPGAGTWHNLSGIAFRATAHFGTVGLAAASGGKVGMWNITDKQHATLDDLLWSATPGGNPHAIERVPDVGAVVTASSDGFLTVYGPTEISDPSTLAEVQQVDLPGAHGVQWDPDGKVLWAVGDKVLRAYEVTGDYRETRLEDTGKAATFGGLGHDLQPDFTDPGKLLITDTSGVYEVSKSSLEVVEISEEPHVKTYVRLPSGGDFWIQAEDVEPRPWASPTVHFTDSDDRTRDGADFYKGRWFSTQWI